jgi:hypothetical protein
MTPMHLRRSAQRELAAMLAPPFQARAEGLVHYLLGH